MKLSEIISRFIPQTTPKLLRMTLIDNEAGNTFDLTELSQGKDRLTIGKDGYGADICLGQGLSGYYYESKLSTVSREHAALIYDGDKNKFYLQDMSKNGTRVNGEPLGEGKRPLKVGDKLMFASYGPVIVARK